MLLKAKNKTAIRVSILGKKNSVLTWQEDLTKAFTSLGVITSFHNLQSESISERLEQLLTKRRQVENHSTAERVAKELRQYKPNIVIVLNKGGISSDANEKWRNALPDQTPIIGWICDRLKGLPAGQLPNFDGLYYFDSSCKVSMEDAYSQTGAKIKYLPLAASASRFKYVATPFEHVREELVFAGNCSSTRRKEILAYRALGGKIDVYGPNSEGLTTKANIKKFNSKQQAKFYRTHFAVFNPPQPVNTLYGLNLRAFEIPLSGGVATYPSSAKDITTCFPAEDELISYNSLEDLKEKIGILKKDPARYLAIREAGRRRVLNEHTFIHRAQKILSDWLTN